VEQQLLQGGAIMAQKVADMLWEMLAKAGVKRCYGIVGDALNPVTKNAGFSRRWPTLT
jgi:thiamine pyrophosphate-dependent acetolactate synthase large subunit-like protein